MHRKRREGDFDGSHYAGRRFSAFLAAMAWSTDSWMPKTLVRPVMRKIFRMR